MALPDRTKVTATAKSGEEKHTWQVELLLKKEIEGDEIKTEDHRREGTEIHRLCARQFVKGLEDLEKSEKEESKKKEITNAIVGLGEFWGLVTKHTNFIAVEDRDWTAPAQTAMKLIDVNESNIVEGATQPNVSLSLLLFILVSPSLSKKNKHFQFFLKKLRNLHVLDYRNHEDPRHSDIHQKYQPHSACCQLACHNQP